tara:strand:- start:899 stop:3178 length:2280 start_codon:yes stop_codon:yes gene_type:complete
MTINENINELIEFLKIHQVNRDYKPVIFALTPSTLAITVQRQQIRALNLVHAICKTWSESPPLQKMPNKENAKIAVIGGGIAGVTATAGLLTKGFEVHLFEQRAELCHLQSGCETRWLHPHIYDWPAPNSDFSDARLPILNWSAGTAGQVTRYVLKQFRKLLNKSESVKSRYNQYLRSNAQLVGNRLHWDNADIEDKQTQGNNFLGRGGLHDFDVILISVGFGVESGVLDPTHTSTSYWRNDHFGQPKPWSRSERQEIVCISGDGDGGLLDLIRVCLQGFKHDRIVDDLFANKELLVDELRKIRESHLADLRRDKNASLFKPLKHLYEQNQDKKLKQQVDDVKNLLRERIRKDTRAILNGRSPSFAEILRTRGRSFFNVFLCFSLYHLDAFSYVGGEYDVSDYNSCINIKGYGQLEFDVFIRRHGTERKSVLEAVGLSSNEVGILFKKQKSNDLNRFSGRLWEPGWWSLPADSHQIEVANQSNAEWLERVPRLEQALAIAYLTPLSENIYNVNGMDGCKFRLTLHRTIHFKQRGDSVLNCYQQIAPYFGNAVSRMAGKPGRVYYTEPEHKKCGAVGISIRKGISFISQLPINTESEKWIELWNNLITSTKKNGELHRHRNMDPEKVTTVVTVPIYARLNDEKRTVRFVLYIDVEHDEQNKTRPDLDELYHLLLATSRGIVKSVQQLKEAEHDDFSLLSVRSAVRDTNGIVISTSDSTGHNLGEFAWLQTEYNDLVRIESFSESENELPDIDELELHAEG